jgi:hypothetical protein
MQLSSLTLLLVSALFKASPQAIQKASHHRLVVLKIFGVTSRFTSIYNGINATVVYALDVAICVGQYLTSSYTKQIGVQVDM